LQKALLDVLRSRPDEVLQRVVAAIPGAPSRPSREEAIEILSVALSDRLTAIKLDDLKQRMQAWSVATKGLRKKQEHVGAILDSPAGAEAAFRELFGQAESQQSLDLEAIGRDIESAVKEAEGADLLKPDELEEIRKLLEQHKGLAVNFRNAEQLMGRGMQSLGVRDMEDAFKSIQTSVSLAQQADDDFRRFAMATLLSATEHIVHSTHLAESNDHEVKKLLAYALTSYRDGVADLGNVLVPLCERCAAIFKDELVALNDVYQTKRILIGNFKNQGVDVFNAERFMRRVEDALATRKHEEAWEYLEKAEKSVVESRNAWMAQIKSELPVAENVIQEARHLGSDTSEAERLISQARVAMEAGDYALCSELTKRSTRKAMEAQQHQIEKAAELQRKQLQRADAMLSSTMPLIQEARAYGIDIASLDTMAQSVRDSLQIGDYVNATSFAKELEESTRLLKPKVEDERARVAAMTTPLGGPCPSCKQATVRFLQTGYGRCVSCGYVFSYQIPQVSQEKKRWGLFGGKKDG
jgi:hypothetical protein